MTEQLAQVMEQNDHPGAHGNRAGTNKRDAIKDEEPSDKKRGESITNATQNETQRLGERSLEEYVNRESSVLLKKIYAPALLTDDGTVLYRSNGHGLDLKVEHHWGLLNTHRAESESGNNLMARQMASESLIESVNKYSQQKPPAPTFSVLAIHLPSEKHFKQALRLDTACTYNLVTRKRILEIEDKMGVELPLQTYSGEAVTLKGRKVLPRFQVTLDWHVLGTTTTRTNTFLVEEEDESFQLLLRREDLNKIGFLVTDLTISHIRHPQNSGDTSA
ncbi:MAG: hypothetical protein Q9200_004235 [Gallowayella weberi]